MYGATNKSRVKQLFANWDANCLMFSLMHFFMINRHLVVCFRNVSQPILVICSIVPYKYNSIRKLVTDPLLLCLYAM